jgi:hypothetical protein
MKKIICLLFLLQSLPLLAQVSLGGKLLERGTRTPLMGVNVFILPAKMKAVTNDKGEFSFENVPEGKFEFIVNNAGYLRLKKESSTDQKEITLYLEKEVYGVFETTVTAIADKRDVTQTSLTQKDFLKAPGAQEDPVKAVQNLPGIANQAASAQVVIQGSEPDDTRYTLNGHEIPIVFHFGGLSSIVMPQAVESVDFLSSGYGPEYGRALGGIINLSTRAPKTDRWHGMAFVDLYNAGGLVEGPIDDKSSLFFSARYSYIGAVLEKVAEDMEDFDLTVAPTFSDMFVDYHRKISDTEEFSMIAIRSRDELQFVIKEPIRNDPAIRGDFYQRTEFYRVIPRYTKKLSDTSSIDVSLGYGDNNILVEVGENYFDLVTSTFSQRAEYKKQQSENYTWFVGLDAQRVNYEVGIQVPRRAQGTGASTGDLAIAQVDGADWESAVFMRNRFTFDNEKWIFSPNLRISNYTQTEESYIMPRLSLVYQKNKDLSYHLATGLYYQAPQNGEATEEFGNPELKAEKSVHLNIGLQQDFRKGSSNGYVLNIDGFYKDLSDLIVNTSDTFSDGTPKVYANDGTGTIYGLQALVKYKYNEWSLVGAYTYLQSTRDEPGRNTYPSEFDQTHNLNLIGSYERSRWTYSARLRYVTGRPYTGVESAIYDSDSDVYIPVRGAFLAERYEPFFQFDLRFDRKWIYDSWILSAYLDIQNLTNNQNVQSISYNFDYSKEVETSALPILPIFGVKGEF